MFDGHTGKYHTAGPCNGMGEPHGLVNTHIKLLAAVYVVRNSTFDYKIFYKIFMSFSITVLLTKIL